MNNAKIADTVKNKNLRTGARCLVMVTSTTVPGHLLFPLIEICKLVYECVCVHQIGRRNQVSRQRERERERESRPSARIERRRLRTKTAA